MGNDNSARFWRLNTLQGLRAEAEARPERPADDEEFRARQAADAERVELQRVEAALQARYRRIGGVREVPMVDLELLLRTARRSPRVATEVAGISTIGVLIDGDGARHSEIVLRGDRPIGMVQVKVASDGKLRTVSSVGRAGVLGRDITWIDRRSQRDDVLGLLKEACDELGVPADKRELAAQDCFERFVRQCEDGWREAQRDIRPRDVAERLTQEEWAVQFVLKHQSPPVREVLVMGNVRPHVARYMEEALMDDVTRKTPVPKTVGAPPPLGQWKVERLAVLGGGEYRFHVEGVNRADPKKPERFAWSVPTVKAEAYDLTRLPPFTLRAVAVIERTDTTAFQDIGRLREVGLVLSRAAAEIADHGQLPLLLRDTNGVEVGRFDLVESVRPEPVINAVPATFIALRAALEVDAREPRQEQEVPIDDEAPVRPTQQRVFDLADELAKTHAADVLSILREHGPAGTVWPRYQQLAAQQGTPDQVASDGRVEVMLDAAQSIFHGPRKDWLANTMREVAERIVAAEAGQELLIHDGSRVIGSVAISDLPDASPVPDGPTVPEP